MGDSRAKQRLAEADYFLKVGPGVVPKAAEAVARYEVLAREGDVDAMLRLSVLAAEGRGRDKDWNAALDFLMMAAERSAADSLPQKQLRLLAGAGEHEPPAALRARVDLNALLTPPPRQPLAQVSNVAAIPGFAPAGFSEWLIERTRDRLEPTMVDEAATGQRKRSTERTATHAQFGISDRDLVCAVMQERASKACGIPVPYHEAPSVISYEPGQYFAPHYDWCSAEIMDAYADYGIKGQRIVTVVTYLNSDFEGGPTRFPKLNVEYRGGVGDAVIFANVFRDGQPDMNTLHEGAPVTAGRKWVLSQWIRAVPQPMRF